MSKVTKIDDLLKQRVEMNPQPDMPLDDYLIELAKKSDINFIVDATDFPSDAKVQPYPAGAAAIAGLQSALKDKWQPTLLNRLSDVAAEHPMSQLRQGERTFLFWKEPDVRELGRLIAQERESQPVLTVANLSSTQDQLADYLQRTHGWKAGEPQPDIKIRFVDFPPDVRAALHQVVRAEVSGSIQHGGHSTTSQNAEGQDVTIYKEDLLAFRVPETLWFSDEFWKNARIKGHSQSEKLKGTNVGQTRSVSYLIVSDAAGKVDNRSLFQPIGRLNLLPEGR